MFQNLTIVAITGTSAYTHGSMYSVARSCLELPGAQGLLISPECPNDLPSSIRHIACKPFSYIEYNLFVIYTLNQFIQTDYCLLVQNDGWVLNGQNWDDTFWNYDFIGAPIPLLGQLTENGGWRLDNFQVWQENQHLLNHPNFYEPQNGGFSLRSKKLLELPSKLGLEWIVRPPKLSANNPVAMEWEVPLHHEDIFLTSTYRQTLQQAGILYAPPQVATRFAMESSFINQMRNVPIDKILGAHWMQYLTLTDINRVALKETNPEKRHAMEIWLYTLGYTIEPA